MELIKKYFTELNLIQLSQYSELFDQYKNCNNKMRDALIRLEIFFKPSGPLYTPYIPAITANNTRAVPILVVALSRFICC